MELIIKYHFEAIFYSSATEKHEKNMFEKN